MIGQRSRCSKMPCESCAVQFSVFKRKQVCCECERYYCSACLRREGAYVLCSACKVLSTRPLLRNSIAHLKVRDLQCFLQRQNVSTRGCVEKEELVTLCVSHVNSAAFRRRGPRARPSPFSTLKGFTTNLNVLINNAFEIRTNPQPAPPRPHSNCYNAAHTHVPSAAPRPAPRPAVPTFYRERFTTTPGGERDIVVPVPGGAGVGADGGGGAGERRRSSAESVAARVDTADCFEIEDLDDAGWEFVTRPADPLPNDSEILIEESGEPPQRNRPPDIEVTRPAPVDETEPPTAPASGDLGAGSGVSGASPSRVLQNRATSELELRPREPSPPAPDSVSLQDEPALTDGERGTPERSAQVSLEQFGTEEQLDALSVRQLKELLARNRVAYRGCLERADLLERARMLWRDHAAYRAGIFETSKRVLGYRTSSASDVRGTPDAEDVREGAGRAQTVTSAPAAEIDRLPLEECCKICMAAPLECVLLECGHIAACTRCAKQLAECPICRQYVVRAVRCFRS